MRRIFLAILWFIVEVVVIKWIIVPIIVWLLPLAGITGFPVAMIALGVIIILFIYLIIGLIAGWKFTRPWDRTL